MQCAFLVTWILDMCICCSILFRFPWILQSVREEWRGLAKICWVFLCFWIRVDKSTMFTSNPVPEFMSLTLPSMQTHTYVTWLPSAWVCMSIMLTGVQSITPSEYMHSLEMPLSSRGTEGILHGMRHYSPMFMYMFIHMYIFACAYLIISMYKSVCIPLCICGYIYKHTQAVLCIYIYIYIHTYTYMYVQILYLHACMVQCDAE